jgi:hypothetical protein
MRGGFRISCVRPTSRRTFARQLSSGRVAVEGAIEQGETVATAQPAHLWPASVVYTCLPCLLGGYYSEDRKS